MGRCNQLSCSQAQAHLIRVAKVVAIFDHHTIAIQKQRWGWLLQGFDQQTIAFKAVSHRYRSRGTTRVRSGIHHRFALLHLLLPERGIAAMQLQQLVMAAALNDPALLHHAD